MKRSYVQLFILGACLAAPGSLLQAQSREALASAAERVAPRMTEYRHTIHRHPELGNREVKTGHHTPTFYADDKAIPIGIRAMTSLVLDFLATPKS